MLQPILVILSSVLVGAVLGYVMGFSIAAHPDVMAGVRPKTNSKFLLFMARPTASFSFLEGILFLLVMLAWLPTFFALFAVPAMIGNQLGVQDSVTITVAYVVLGGVLLFARRFGVKAWNALT
jgi:hypothetical protein